jgi:hypothetical protein
MKTANILFLIVLILAFVPQLGIIYVILAKSSWANGKRLWLDSFIVWIFWLLTTLLTGIFLSVIETATASGYWGYPPIGELVKMHLLRLAVLIFVSTGIIAGMLHLLKNYFWKEPSRQSVWRTSATMSFGINPSFYALMMLLFLILASIFGTF